MGAPPSAVCPAPRLAADAQGMPPLPIGRQSFAMVQRYAHLSPDTLRRAVKTLESSMRAATATGNMVRLGDR